MQPPSTTRPTPDLLKQVKKEVFKIILHNPNTRQFEVSFQTARSFEITVAHTQFSEPSCFHQITKHKLKNEKSIT
jgi:hypothetical protein